LWPVVHALHAFGLAFRKDARSLANDRQHRTASERAGGYSLIEPSWRSASSALAALACPPRYRRQDIQTSTKQVIADYRWARNRAITSGVHFGVEWTATNAYEIQRVKQAPTARGRRRDREERDPAGLHQHAVVLAVPGVQHARDDGHRTYPLYQMFWDSNYYGWHMLSVWPSGQIYEEY
jgi:hypothetical protein